MARRCGCGAHFDTRGLIPPLDSMTGGAREVSEVGEEDSVDSPVTDSSPGKAKGRRMKTASGEGDLKSDEAKREDDGEGASKVAETRPEDSREAASEKKDHEPKHQQTDAPPVSQEAKPVDTKSQATVQSKGKARIMRFRRKRR